MKLSYKKATAGVTGLVVLFAVLVVLNYLVGDLRLRADLTKDKVYTLSDGTRGLLGGLDRNVVLKFYFNRSLAGLPAPLKQYGERVLDLLREYEAAGGGRISLEVYDPQPDSEEEEWAGRYGIEGRPIAMALDAPSLYLGVAAVSGAKEGVIPFLNPEQEPQLEYLVTRLVGEVTRDQKPKIGVLAGLPVLGGPGQQNPFQPRRGGGERPWYIATELRAQYDVVPVLESAEEIPADIDTLLVIHPKELGEATLFALDQFVLRGGRLLAFLDTMCISDQSSAMPGMFGMPPSPESDLNRLTEKWGLTFSKGRVVADGEAATPIRAGGDRPVVSPSWLSLRPEHMAAGEIAVAGLERVMLPFAGHFTGKPVDGLTLTPLIQCSTNSGTMDSFSAQRAGDAVEIQKAAERPLLALRLSGKFKTAFPEGKPAAGDTNAPPAASTNVLKEGVKESAVVLVGDADLLADRFCVAPTMFGERFLEMVSDNIPLCLNLLEQLSGNPALISLRSRGSYQRPFDRVIRMEAAADQRWREKEIALQKQLEETQTRLSELQTRKDASQKLVMSPEQKAEIEKFKAQMAQTRKELKEVRKSLRQDIERLGMWVKALNIAAVPLGVAVLGLGLGLRRRAKAVR